MPVRRPQAACSVHRPLPPSSPLQLPRLRCGVRGCRTTPCDGDSAHQPAVAVRAVAQRPCSTAAGPVGRPNSRWQQLRPVWPRTRGWVAWRRSTQRAVAGDWWAAIHHFAARPHPLCDPLLPSLSQPPLMRSERGLPSGVACGVAPSANRSLLGRKAAQLSSSHAGNSAPRASPFLARATARERDGHLRRPPLTISSIHSGAPPLWIDWLHAQRGK